MNLAMAENLDLLVCKKPWCSIRIAADIILVFFRKATAGLAPGLIRPPIGASMEVEQVILHSRLVEVASKSAMRLASVTCGTCAAYVMMLYGLV